MMATEDGAVALLVTRSVAALIAIALLLLAIAKAGGFAVNETDNVQAPTPISLAWVRPLRLLAMLPAATLAAAAGLLNSVGHVSYVHAATQGSIAVAASLTALFPAVFVMLAVVVLREKVVPKKYLGLAASAAGAMVMST